MPSIGTLIWFNIVFKYDISMNPCYFKNLFKIVYFGRRPCPVFGQVQATDDVFMYINIFIHCLISTVQILLSL